MEIRTWLILATVGGVAIVGLLWLLRNQSIAAVDEELPAFRYHPDPVATGTIVRSTTACPCCGRSRGYSYVGPFYSTNEIANICPWCIASGEAADKFDGEFTDGDSIGTSKAGWPKVSDEVRAEVARRTPGYFSIQGERWWTHCDDAGAYIGTAGYDDLQKYGENLAASIRKDLWLPEEQHDAFLQSLSRDVNDDAVAHVFKCPNCGAYGGYAESD